MWSAVAADLQRRLEPAVLCRIVIEKPLFFTKVLIAC